MNPKSVGTRQMLSLKTSILLAAFWLVLAVASPAADPYRIVWGDVHGHTALSDGKGTPDDYFIHARNIAKLDFVILTDHDFGNGRPEWRMPKASWTLIQDKADQFNANGRFVAIGGYEWTSQAKYWAGFTNGPSERLFPGPPKQYNHKNVYFPGRVDYLFSAKDVTFNTPDSLAEVVRKHGGLIHNNHPSADAEGENQFAYNPSQSAVIANTEMLPDTTQYEGKTYHPKMEQTLRAFLNQGGKTGFVAGSDTHEGKPAARTAVLVRELTREAIFDALRKRRNYAINHARIVLDFQINGHVMGEDIEIAGKPQIVVEVKGTDKVEEVIIVRDGSVLHSIKPGARAVRFEYTDHSFNGASYYYVRVLQADKDQHGNHSHAWSSPIWVKGKR